MDALILATAFLHAGQQPVTLLEPIVASGIFRVQNVHISGAAREIVVSSPNNNISDRVSLQTIVAVTSEHVHILELESKVEGKVVDLFKTFVRDTTTSTVKSFGFWQQVLFLDRLSGSTVEVVGLSAFYTRNAEGVKNVCHALRDER